MVEGGATMHKVLIADAIAEEGLTYLRARPAFEVVVATGESPEALMSRIAACDAVIVCSSAHIARAILSWAERLRLIGRAGIGVDNIDVESNMVCVLVTEQYRIIFGYSSWPGSVSLEPLDSLSYSRFGTHTSFERCNWN